MRSSSSALVGLSLMLAIASMEITVKGTRIRSVLNGVTVVDYDGAGVLDDAAHQQRGVGLRGSIGLQIHMNDELELRFRDLRIKEL